MSPLDRRLFLQSSAALAGSVALPTLPIFAQEKAATPEEKQVGFGFGLVTYMWGAEWDLPTLLKNCAEHGLQSVELRTTHKHGVEPNLNEAQREEVRKRFEDGPVSLVGLGSNERFDSPDPAVVKKAIETTKEFVRLSHDIGGSGVKVKPDSFPKDVPREKTIEQIGKALNELGEYAAGFGQQIRLEIHGQVGADIPAIKQIMDIAKDENVALCWNSNNSDLNGDGLEKNFALVRPRFGATLHVRELTLAEYPWQTLFNLLAKSNWEGFMLLEAASKPADKLAAIDEQVKLFREMVTKALGA